MRESEREREREREETDRQTDRKRESPSHARPRKHVSLNIMGYLVCEAQAWGCKFLSVTKPALHQTRASVPFHGWGGGIPWGGGYLGGGGGARESQTIKMDV